MPLMKAFDLDPFFIESWWMAELKGALSSPKAEGIMAEMEGKSYGFAVSAPLPWESAILGKRMSALKQLSIDPLFPEREHLLLDMLKNRLKYAAREAFDFILCKTDERDVAVEKVLADQGFQQMDTLLSYVCQLRDRTDAHRGRPLLPEGCYFRSASSTDTENLVQVVRASFSDYFGRFHMDRCIGSAEATKVYEEWIRSCLQGWADWTLLVQQDEHIIGYASWKITANGGMRDSPQIGQLSIIGVHPDHFGRGVATSLIAEGMRRLSGNMDYIYVLTHIQNIAMQRALEKLGWKISGEQRSYHKWMTS